MRGSDGRSNRGTVRLRRRGLLLALWLAAALHLLAPSAGGNARGGVYLLDLDGVINPLTAQYLSGQVRQAEEAQAGAVVVRLNTPGGLETSMREMTRAILNATVPVVVYVTPPGARAASAGMFVTIAAHVAAMAPGTNIGAAHPVGLGGETDPTMSEKLENDAAALARSIATIRGRNAEWAERAVRESVSITAAEALDQNVIDVVAGDLQELLREIDGRQVETAGGSVTLRTAEAPVVERPMNLPEHILQVIIDPNIAFILFTIGTIGIIAELYNPGALFPGITGAISLILAFVPFGNLPINWAGVLLLLLAVGLFMAELYVEGIGILAVGGLIAFVVGALMLFTPFAPTSPAMPDLQVSPWLIAALALGISVFFLVVMRAVFRAWRAPVATGTQALVGRTAVAVTDLAPRGNVRLDSEDWTAVAEDERIGAGGKVQVVQVEGVTLKVKRQ